MVFTKGYTNFGAPDKSYKWTTSSLLLDMEAS